MVDFNERQISYLATQPLGEKIKSYGNIFIFLDMTGPYKKRGTFFVTFDIENLKVSPESLNKWHCIEH